MALAPQTGLPQGDRPSRVLVVDDEESITQLVATVLRYEGFEVECAADGRSAVRAAQSFRPDLVVLDVMLPDWDGFEVYRRLANETAQIPVLFLTARDATADRVHGLTLGADDYVGKPFSLEELVARVRAVLRRTRRGPRRRAALPRMHPGDRGALPLWAALLDSRWHRPVRLPRAAACGDTAVMDFGVLRPDDLEFEQRPYRPQDPVRSAAALSDALGLTQSRASVWRYPAGSRGRRHRELAQEEVFVVLDGAVTMMLGDPPQREELPARSIVRVAPGTPLQIHNDSGGEATLLIWGAPPERGRAEILNDLE